MPDRCDIWAKAGVEIATAAANSNPEPAIQRRRPPATFNATMTSLSAPHFSSAVAIFQRRMARARTIASACVRNATRQGSDVGKSRQATHRPMAALVPADINLGQRWAVLISPPPRIYTSTPCGTSVAGLQWVKQVTETEHNGVNFRSGGLGRCWKRRPGRHECGNYRNGVESVVAVFNPCYPSIVDRPIDAAADIVSIVTRRKDRNGTCAATQAVWLYEVLA